MFAQDDTTIDNLCKCLSTEFLLQDKGNIASYLSIQITHTTEPDGSSITITMTDFIRCWPHRQESHAKIHANDTSPSAESVAALFDASCNYCSIIGKLSFLAQNMHLDISMPIHMCVQYVNNPNQSHQDAVKYLC